MQQKRKKRRQLLLTERAQKAKALDGGSPLLITVDEFAARLRIGRVQAYRLINAQKVRSVKIGRSRRIVVASLAQLES